MRPANAPQRLKIGVQREALNGAPVHADCLAAVDDAIALLTDLGHNVEEAVPRYDVSRIGAAYPLVIAANVQAAIDQHAEETGNEPSTQVIENVVNVLGAMGHDRNAVDMVRAVWAMHATAARSRHSSSNTMCTCRRWWPRRRRPLACSTPVLPMSMPT